MKKSSKEKKLKKTFQEYYQKVSYEQAKALQSFRQSVTYYTLIHKGIQWTYYLAGSGRQILMIIPGGLRKPESIFQELQLFQNDFRVLAPDIPFLMDSDDVLDGFLAILDQEKIDKVNLAGRSFGGSLAQGFAALYPDKVRRLILCSTVYSDESHLKKTDQALKTYLSMPERMVRSMTKWAFFNILKRDLGPDGKKYWKAYLNELFDSISVKEMMLSQLSIGKDLILRHPFTPVQISGFGDHILIIFAENDKVISGKDQARYKEYFPNAKIKIFHTGGHILFQTQASEYFETIKDFITAE